MTSVYIISDNQYFALGAAAMLTHQKALIVSPEAVLNQEITITDGICYIFARDRMLHRQLCRYFKHTYCNLIFFLPGIRYSGDPKLLPCFWSARISAKSFRTRSTQISRYFKRYPSEMTTRARHKRVCIAAEGMEHYMRWVNARSTSPRIVHSHHRTLISTIGIDNVSIHTLFLAEYIAAGRIALT
ncbi:hypothetical protein UXP46_23705 [Enterobacter ludwigii]|uniref:hypothetical protein n=1 Tax=Enterobacter ludwigii TaxID=299767 RepID=UPI002FD66F55